jgi:conserved oligomeric Golgi complex subunit 8
VPQLDEKALEFSQKYSKSNTENAVLDRRKKAMLLSRNVDRVSDILELPTLLATAIASSSAPTSSSGSAPSGGNYSQALDLFANIKRLQMLHPDSALIQSVLAQSEEVMKEMTSNLITSLRSQNVRLAGAIRTIGWLRRVAPELSTPSSSIISAQSGNYASTTNSTQSTSEGSFGYLFLTCRLYNLLNMLEALAPLRDLADQETQQREQKQNNSSISSPSIDQSSVQRKPSVYNHSAFAGQQTERYLKRFIEIFREQSFATVSMYKNIFPASLDNMNSNPPPASQSRPQNSSISNPVETATAPAPFLTLPNPLATFPSHLISLLTETLQTYLPNLTDPSARDSLLMQVLYAAGSLGRLSADFSMIVSSLLDDDDDHDDEDPELCPHENSAKEEAIAQTNNRDNAPSSQPHQANPATPPNQTETPNQKEKTEQTPEWIRIMKKHRLQSSRLEALSSAPAPTPTSGSGNQDQQTKDRLPVRRGSSQHEATVK